MKRKATATTDKGLVDKRSHGKHSTGKPRSVQRNMVEPEDLHRDAPITETPTQPATTVDLPIDSIVVKAEFMGRATTNRSTVKQYVELMKNGTTFPPVVVYVLDDENVLVDGFHRLEAAKQLGKDTISAEVRHGTEEEALAYAVTANDKHGRPLTMADKRHNAGLVMEKHPDWSDRRVADMIGMSPTTIGTIRSQLSNLDSSASRRGKDGKIRRPQQSSAADDGMVGSAPFDTKTSFKRIAKVLTRELELWPESARSALGDFLYEFAEKHCPSEETD